MTEVHGRSRPSRLGPLALFGGAPLLARADLRTWPPIGDQVREELGRVLDRGVLGGGDAPAARELEARFAEALGTRHALLTHAGTSAIQIALAAAKIGPGDEVVVPAYGYIAGPMCVLAQGAIPRFVDVDRETGNLDPAEIEATSSERTRAILPMHIHGCPADMDEVSAVARRHGLRVIEDAAQAHGATYRGKNVGALGVMAAFSLHESKALPAGEGGLFVTDDDALMEKALQVRSFGQDLRLKDRSRHDPRRALDTVRPHVSLRPGQMFRGNEMMAAVALAQLPRLRERIAAVQRNAEALRAGLAGLPGLHLQDVAPDRTSAWYKVRLHFDVDAAQIDLPPRSFRDRLCAALVAEGVEAGLWQDALLPEHPVFARLEGFGRRWPYRLHPDPRALRESYDAARFPRGRALLDSSLVLFSERRPLIAQRTETVERVAAAIRAVWAQRGALVTSSS